MEKNEQKTWKDVQKRYAMLEKNGQQQFDCFRNYC